MFVAVVVVLFVMGLSVQAQRIQPFTGSQTAATNRASVVIAPDIATPLNAAARINFLNVTSDLATATVTFYRPGAPKKIANASSGATNRVWFASPVGNDFATSNQVILVRRKATTTSGTDSWDRLTSLTNTATSVTFTAVTGGAVRAGDEVYICTAHASILAGANASKEWAYNQPFYNGEAGRAVLVEASATTLGKIPIVTGWWQELPK